MQRIVVSIVRLEDNNPSHAWLCTYLHPVPPRQTIYRVMRLESIIVADWCIEGALGDD